jgi:hypothetical protein
MTEHGAECLDRDLYPFPTFDVSPLYRFIAFLYSYLKSSLTFFCVHSLANSSFFAFCTLTERVHSPV